MNYQRYIIQPAYTIEGNWLFDANLDGAYVSNMQTLAIGKQQALAVNCQASTHSSVLSVFGLKEKELVLLDKFTPPSSTEIFNNEIHSVLHLNDTAQHGIKTIYCWNEVDNKFTEIKREIFFWFGENCVDYNEPIQVVQSFCEALFLNLKDEALGYCNERVRFTFGEENFKYTVKHPQICIRNIINDYKENANYQLKKTLKTKPLFINSERAAILAYYDQPFSESFIQPSQMARIGLQFDPVREKWEIVYVNYLFDNIYTQIIWQQNLNSLISRDMLSIFARYTLKLDYFTNFHIICIDKNDNRFNTAYIDDCSLLEITEKYPGVQIAFFRPDSFRRCYFDFYNAQEININTNSGNEIIIRVIF